MKKIMLCAGIIAISFQVFALPRKCCATKTGCVKDSVQSTSFHYLQFGGVLVDNGSINSRLDENGIGEFSDYTGSVGFGTARFVRRYVSVNDLQFLFWKKSYQNNLIGKLGAARFTSLHGIQLIEKAGFSFYPLAGIGAGLTSFSVRPEKRSFDDALTGTPSMATGSALFQPTFLFDVGVGAHFTKKMQKHNKTGIVGLRAGYIFDPVKSNRWYQGRTEIPDGPDGNLSGPYLRLTMGFASAPSCRAHGRKGCRKAGTCGRRK